MGDMSGIPTVAVTDLADDAVVLDVREDDEWAAGRAPGAVHIVMSEIPAQLHDLPDVEPVAVICRSGGRSGQVVAWLNAQGIDAVNVDGGMRAWAGAAKPIVGDDGTPRVI